MTLSSRGGGGVKQGLPFFLSKNCTMKLVQDCQDGQPSLRQSCWTFLAAPYLPWPLLNQFMVLKSETILNQACPRMAVWWSTTVAAAGPLHKGFFFSRVTSACSNNKVHEDCEFILNSQFVWNYCSWSLSSLHKKICELQCGYSPGIMDLPSCRRPLMQVQQILYQTCKGLLKPLCGWS